MPDNSQALTWADLFANGSLIDLDVRMWDGLLRLKPSDLGIDASNESVQQALTFGHERLVAKSALEAIRESAYQARKAVENNTIGFDLIPGSRFIPKGNRDGLQYELDELAQEFRAGVNKFLQDYGQHRSQQQQVIREALMVATGDAAVVERAVSRIISEYPSEGDLSEKFSIGWHFFSIASPQDGTRGNEGSALRKSIEEMIDSLRSKLVERVQGILELVNRGGKITQKTFNSASALCERLQKLNVFGDPGLSIVIGQVRNALEAAANSETAAESLKDGLGSVEDELARSREQAIEAVAHRLAGQGERRLTK